MSTSNSILLVEDDLVDVMIFKRAMADLKAKASTLVASTGEEALVTLAKCNGYLPALIIMDLNMPRMNGIELLEILNTHAEWRRIPAVVLTTSDQEEERQKCLALSAAGYVVKPSDYDDFVKVLEDMLIYHNFETRT